MKTAKSKIIGICGGSCSGKTTLAKRVESRLGLGTCRLLFQDSYYKDQSHKFKVDGGEVNFDHPDALDFRLMGEQLRSLSNGAPIEVPHYDFATHRRTPQTTHVFPLPKGGIILVDGTLILQSQEIFPLFDFSLFLLCPESLRFERRKKRDVIMRGRSLEGVIAQFQNHVKPMHDAFVEPSKAHATKIFDSVEQFDLAEEQIMSWSGIKG